LTSEPCAPQTAAIFIDVIGEPLSGQPVADPSICSDALSADLFDFITGEQPGGQWFDAGGNPVSSQIDVSTPGNYSYTYQVANVACGPRTTPVTINSIPEPNAGVSLGDATVCVGEVIDLPTYIQGADPDGVWTDNTGAEVDDQITIAEEGTYTFTYTVTRPPCAPVSSSVNFEVVQGPNPGQAQNPVEVCLGGPAFNLLDLMQGADKGGVWTDDQGNTVESFFDPQTAGTYNFTYTVTNDECGDISANLTIDVSGEYCNIPGVIIPQGFSPNGDGIADEWIIQGITQYPNNSLTIFNRWGAEIYAARPYLNRWNGTSQSGLGSGEDLPVGTYWYILDLGDGSEVRKGYVYLNR
jgi:gliding motility-associated-like protein